MIRPDPVVNVSIVNNLNDIPGLVTMGVEVGIRSNPIAMPYD
jgi:hypothetical protein